MYLPAYLPTCLPTYLPTYLPTCLPAYLRTCVPTYLLTYLPTYIHTYLPTYLPTYLLTRIPFIGDCKPHLGFFTCNHWISLYLLSSQKQAMNLNFIYFFHQSICEVMRNQYSNTLVPVSPVSSVPPVSPVSSVSSVSPVSPVSSVSSVSTIILCLFEMWNIEQRFESSSVHLLNNLGA